MKQQKFAGFAVGFLTGVVLTIFCWRALENVYLTEIAGVTPPRQPSEYTIPQPPSEMKAPPAMPAAPAAPIQSQGTTQGPAGAPITLMEYSDFYCPFCSRVVPAVDQLMQNYPGKIHRVWKHFPLPFHQGADKLHEASECAAEQGKFWEFHNEVFADQNKIKETGALERVADKLGLDKARFMACADSRKYQEKVKKDIEEGQKAGVNGTPAALINGHMVSGAVPYEQFKQVVDHFLDPNKVPLPEEPKPQPPQPEAPKGPVKFDDLDGHQSQGPKDAPITIVEFSDFHCPFCSRIIPTIDRIMDENKGKVRQVWRHFPLPFHQGADKTAQASECAGEQGKFWEFHHKAFQAQATLTAPDGLQNIAKELKLDLGKFNACLDSGKFKKLVEEDIKKGAAYGVGGTPATFINGYLITGAMPYEAFKPWIDHFLNPSKFPLPASAAPSPRPSGDASKPVEFKDLKDKPTIGSKKAPVTIVEFSDFHCPFCKRGTDVMDQLLKDYDGKVKLVWRHFPLSMHPGADKTHEASQCAAEQGKFWDFYHKAFASQDQLSAPDGLKKIAQSAGLNMKKFDKCFQSGKYKALVQAEVAAGQAVGVSGTPTFFINGERVLGARPIEDFKAKIDSKLKK